MNALVILAMLSSFDLSCETRYIFGVSEVPPKKVTGKFGPFFKVDLATGRFCEGSCAETHPIAKITATDLFLRLENTGSLKEYLRISRESGQYESRIQIGDGEPFATTGVCEPKPFTGFPTRKF